MEALAAASRSSATPASISPAATSTRRAPSTSRRTRWRRPQAVGPARAARRWPRSGTAGPSSTASTARSTPSRTTGSRCPSRSTTSISATSSGRTWPSGGAGGGMRWPNRHPHQLTAGMRRAQRALAGFLPLIDWPRFRRRPLHGEAGVADPVGPALRVRRRAAGGALSAALRHRRPDGMLDRGGVPDRHDRDAPRHGPGDYRVVAWDTLAGRRARRVGCTTTAGRWQVRVGRLAGDQAVAVRRLRRIDEPRGRPQARRSSTGPSRCASSSVTPSPGMPVSSARPFSRRNPSARSAGKALSSTSENSQLGVTRPACTWA